MYRQRVSFLSTFHNVCFLYDGLRLELRLEFIDGELHTQDHGSQCLLCIIRFSFTEIMDELESKVALLLSTQNGVSLICSRVKCEELYRQIVESRSLHRLIYQRLEVIIDEENKINFSDTLLPCSEYALKIGRFSNKRGSIAKKKLTSTSFTW